jgi:hypothetical protein
MSAARFMAAGQLTSSTRYAVSSSPEAVAVIDRQGRVALSPGEQQAQPSYANGSQGGA